MDLMPNVASEQELKKEYKKLAMIYHPDKGGSTALMQELNREYRSLKDQFTQKAQDSGGLRIGDRVFVNGTECRVIFVSRFAFIAQALHNRRTAVFDRETGFAVSSRKFKAQFYGS